ncbi:RNase H domain-containing protein [Caerostris darwini]|uniref:RNase H domain-containing protein n=1 Tax=Caerostris darwini TaxID=1538125 RepID=A0AAV4N1S3_9ARAC|nr:RNase H domain-containing protein [Caerostris darwini]
MQAMDRVQKERLSEGLCRDDLEATTSSERLQEDNYRNFGEATRNASRRTKLYRLRYLQQSIEIQQQTFTFNDLEKRHKFEPHWDKTKFQWRHMNKKEDRCCIYTNGSKLRGRVGCASVCILNKVEMFSDQKRLSDEASVYMAELKAIESAINLANSHHYSSVKIISDSRSVLQALCNPNNCTSPISFLKSLLRSSTTSCELIWTKAHVGTEGNKIADFYAKQATTREEVDLPTSLSTKYIKSAISKVIKSDWQQQWTTSLKGRAVHELCPLINIQRIHGNYFLNQVITGHGAIAYYQHKFFSSSPVCSCGKEIEDRDHLIYRCENWTAIRRKFFPKNFLNRTLVQLLTQKQARIGIELIMKIKLEKIIETLDT